MRESALRNVAAWRESAKKIRAAGNPTVAAQYEAMADGIARLLGVA